MNTMTLGDVRVRYAPRGYYDPNTGQFLSVDPLAAATGSRYGYTGNNPLNASDPSGLCGESASQDWGPICGFDDEGNQTAFKKWSTREANKIAEQDGYSGAEEMKAELWGTGRTPRLDMYRDSNGDVFVGPKKMTAVSERLYQTGSQGNGEGEYGHAGFGDSGVTSDEPVDPDIGGEGPCVIAYGMAGGCGGEDFEDPWDWFGGDGFFDAAYSSVCDRAGWA